MEIRHIPGKVNPADTITRQVKVDDAEYSGKVKEDGSGIGGHDTHTIRCNR